MSAVNLVVLASAAPAGAAAGGSVDTLNFAILGYTVALGVMWGFALWSLWDLRRSRQRTGQIEEGKT